MRKALGGSGHEVSPGRGDVVEGRSYEVRVHPSCFTGISMVSSQLLSQEQSQWGLGCSHGWWNWGGFPRGHAGIMGESGLGDCEIGGRRR